MYKDLKEIYIGSIIKAKLDKSSISYKDFANAIHCDRTNLYKIFKRKSIDTEQLILISQILHCNLFEEVYLEDSKREKNTVIATIPLPNLNSQDVVIELTLTHE